MQRRRNTFGNRQSRGAAMIPKQQFVKLRKYVLDYLKRNAEGNGYCHIQHGSLDRVIMYAQSRDFHPFSGMSPEQREQATDTFWDTLLRAKQVEMVMAPVTLSGQEGKHYYLPGTQPFHTQTEGLFNEVRRERNERLGLSTSEEENPNPSAG